jgi:hypothetical protein
MDARLLKCRELQHCCLAHVEFSFNNNYQSFTIYFHYCSSGSLMGKEGFDAKASKQGSKQPKKAAI